MANLCAHVPSTTFGDTVAGVLLGLLLTILTSGEWPSMCIVQMPTEDQWRALTKYLSRMLAYNAPTSQRVWGSEFGTRGTAIVCYFVYIRPNTCRLSHGNQLDSGCDVLEKDYIFSFGRLKH